MSVVAKPMTAKQYVAKKSRQELTGIVKILETRLVAKMVDEKTAPSTEEWVEPAICKAFGCPLGTLTQGDPRIAAIHKLRRLANWGDGTADELDGESQYRRIVSVLGKTPDVAGLAKRTARDIIREHVSQEVIDEHGGFADFATMTVVDKLFPPKSGVGVRTAKQEYFSRLADELISLLG